METYAQPGPRKEFVYGAYGSYVNVTLRKVLTRGRKS